MIKIIVPSFEWDRGNREKCQKHGLSIAEIEFIFQGRPRIAPDTRHSKEEDRLIAVGETEEGRAVFVAFTLRHKNGQTFIRRCQRPVYASEGG